jgi:hypothetical protein
MWRQQFSAVIPGRAERGPGIQMQVQCVYLDSGFAPSVRPEMTAEMSATFYSIFTPAALTTSPHFTRCSRVKAVKASGLSDSTESAPALLS